MGHPIGVVEDPRKARGESFDCGFASLSRSKILAQDDNLQKNNLRKNILAKRNHGKNIGFDCDGE